MLTLPEGMIVHPPDRKVTLEWWTFSVAAHWLRSFHWTFMWVPCPMDFYHLILRSWQLNGCMTNITTLWNHSCHCLKLVVDVQNLGNGHDVLYLRHLHCCPGTLESMVIISGYSRGSWRSVSIGQVFLKKNTSWKLLKPPCPSGISQNDMAPAAKDLGQTFPHRLLHVEAQLHRTTGLHHPGGQGCTKQWGIQPKIGKIGWNPSFQRSEKYSP